MASWISSTDRFLVLYTKDWKGLCSSWYTQRPRPYLPGPAFLPCPLPSWPSPSHPSPQISPTFHLRDLILSKGKESACICLGPGPPYSQHWDKGYLFSVVHVPQAIPGLSCQVLTETVTTQYIKEENKPWWLLYSCIEYREVGSVLGLQVGISRLREDADSEVRTEPGPGLLSCLDLIPDPPL